MTQAFWNDENVTTVPVEEFIEIMDWTANMEIESDLEYYHYTNKTHLAPSNFNADFAGFKADTDFSVVQAVDAIIAGAGRVGPANSLGALLTQEGAREHLLARAEMVGQGKVTFWAIEVIGYK